MTNLTIAFFMNITTWDGDESVSPDCKSSEAQRETVRRGGENESKSLERRAYYIFTKLFRTTS
jgi:hypothetical protein